VALVVGSVVEQDRDRAKGRADLFDSALQCTGVAQIGMLKMDSAAFRAHRVHHLGRGLRRNVDEADPGALCGEALHQRLTDARSAAGDQHGPAFQIRVNRSSHSFLQQLHGCLPIRAST
jgi:hypothetical protein